MIRLTDLDRQYILGPTVHEFEKQWAAYCDAKHCVTVANGTDALYLALVALGISEGDRVVTVANAGGYATNAILRAGATPEFVEVDPRTLLIQCKQPFDNFDPPDAAIITHLYGSQVDIAAARKSFNCPIIEDCSHAHGIELCGDIACFSFYPTKNLGAHGDAGAIVTNDQTTAEILKALRQYGWREKKYRVGFLGGINSRMDEVQAEVLLRKLPMLEYTTALRRKRAAELYELINHRNIAVVPQNKSFYHQLVIRTDAELRSSLMSYLADNKIESTVHYPIPDHLQSLLTNKVVWLPETELACSQVLSIPCHPGLSYFDIKNIARAINEWNP